MRGDLEREIAVAALGGGTGSEPIRAFVTKSLVVLRSARLKMRSYMPRGDGACQYYVRVSLPRGVTALLHVPTAWYGVARMVPLLTILSVRGKRRSYYDVPCAAHELTRRAGTDAATATRILLGLERARRRCDEVAEEATRWL